MPGSPIFAGVCNSRSASRQCAQPFCGSFGAWGPSITRTAASVWAQSWTRNSAKHVGRRLSTQPRIANGDKRTVDGSMRELEDGYAAVPIGVVRKVYRADPVHRSPTQSPDLVMRSPLRFLDACVQIGVQFGRAISGRSTNALGDAPPELSSGAGVRQYAACPAWFFPLVRPQLYSCLLSEREFERLFGARTPHEATQGGQRHTRRNAHPLGCICRPDPRPG